MAALIYDIVLLQTKGMHANINFNYSARELLGILFSEPLHKVKIRGEMTECRDFASEEKKEKPFEKW